MKRARCPLRNCRRLPSEERFLNAPSFQAVRLGASKDWIARTGA
jgi:hypothetical protein